MKPVEEFRKPYSNVDVGVVPQNHDPKDQKPIIPIPHNMWLVTGNGAWSGDSLE